MGLDLIYTAVLFVVMFVNVAFMLLGVRLLSLVVCIFSLGFCGLAWGDSIAGEIPFSPYVQVMVALVCVVCLLVVGVRGKHFGD